jgi:hypothetical protein
MGSVQRCPRTSQCRDEHVWYGLAAGSVGATGGGEAIKQLFGAAYDSFVGKQFAAEPLR